MHYDLKMPEVYEIKVLNRVLKMNIDGKVVEELRNRTVRLPRK